MLRIEVKKMNPAGAELNGATMGEAHVAELRGLIMAAPSEGQVLLDFDGVASASASYLKRILNPFFVPLSDAESFRREVFPVISNLNSKDLREDMEAYLASSERVLILAEKTEAGVQFLDLLGPLDGAAAETFTALRNLKTATAAQLYFRDKDRMSNQTAWNNRLARLVEMRIARRRREGRNWIYQPTLTA